MALLFTNDDYKRPVDIGADEFTVYIVKASDYETITITISETLELSEADVKYNELPAVPDSANLSLNWSVISGPAGWDDPPCDDGICPFEDNNVLKARANFPRVGTYVLMLEVLESNCLAGRDFVTVNVLYDVSIVSDPAELTLPDNLVNLDATVTGAGPTYVCYWSGPDAPHPEVDFSDAENVETTATFAKPGIYNLTLQLFDDETGLLVGQGKVTIPVGHQQINVIIEADRDNTTWPDNRVNLTATIIGGVPFQVTWYPPQGEEDSVYFGGLDNEGIHDYQTYVDFDEWGIYNLWFTAEDGYGDVVGVGNIEITVNPPSSSSLIVYAGEDQTIAPPQNFVFLNGSVEGAGELDLTYEWLPPLDNTGSPLVEFAAMGGDLLAVMAKFISESAPAPGDYLFTLLVRESEQVVGVDEVIVTVSGDPVYTPSIAIDIQCSDTTADLPVGGSVPVELTGEITDDIGLVDENQNEWVCYSEQGNVIFAPALPVRDEQVITQQVNVTFTAPGEYHIGFIAKNTSGDELACVIMVISVTSQNVFVGVTSDPEPPVVVTLFQDATVNLTATASPLNFNWSAWEESSGTVKFSNVTYNQSDVLSTSTATAEFGAVGVFHPRFTVKAGGEGGLFAGSGSAQVIVYSPKVVVTAKAGGERGFEVESLYAVFYTDPESTITIYLDADITYLDATETYQWQCIKWPEGATQYNPNPVDALQTEVILSKEGLYVFQLLVYADGEYVGSGEVDVVLLSGMPVVSVGRNYKIAATGEPFPLDKAYVLDDAEIIPGNINWSSDPDAGVSWNPDPPHAENPSVTFTNEDSYDLTITYSDNVFPVVSNTETIRAIDAAYVYAGDPKITIPFAKLPLDDVIVDPPDPIKYKWTVSDVLPELVVFEPSDSVKEPTITYIEKVESQIQFMLTLTVNDGYPPYINTSDVHITILPNPLDDDTPPVITIETEPSIENGQTDVHGDILITAQAFDEQGLDRIELKVTDGGANEMELPSENYEIIAGTQDKPIELELTYLLDHYYRDSVNLVATAFDRAGNSNTDTISFDSIHNIQNFTVTIEPNPDYVANLSDTITFDFILNSPGWSFEILDPGNSVIYSPEPGGDTEVSLYDSADNFNIESNGPHTARLTANGDTADRTFNVILAPGGLSGPPSADISNLENAADYWNVTARTSTLPEVTEGFFTLKGTATHGVFPEEVYYKVELFDKEIEMETYAYDALNNLYYELEEWKNYPYYVVKNVTPGHLEGGWHHGGDVEGILGEIDFTGVPSGTYQMLLTVKCHDKFAYDRVEFVLNCPLKLGNVKFSQEDLSITVGGVPLRIVRTYDSFKKNEQSDFGFGWTYSIANLDIKLNEQRRFGLRSSNNCDRNVTLTLPNGERATFTFGLEDESYGYNTSLKAIYSQPTGVYATLETEPDYWLRYYKSPGELFGCFYWDRSGTSYNKFYCVGAEPWRHDFAGFILTMEDGSTYHISRAGGTTDVVNSFSQEQLIEKYGKPYLKLICLPSGEKIFFDVDTSDEENPITNFVRHYLPGTNPENDPYDPDFTTSIQIIRDDPRFPDCITKIMAPGDDADFPSLKYEYDTFGNLVKVKKLVDKYADTENKRYETTTYLYADGVRQPNKHFITDIKDPRGLSPIRYVYDETGRLVATIDAKDNRIELAHALYDPDYGDYEEVTDRGGNKTKYFYDSRGNVVLMQQYNSTEQLQDWTQYLYEDSYNPNKPTSIITPVPDPANPSQTIYAETEYNYCNEGRPYLIIDPEGNTIETEYNSIGDVLWTTQWLPGMTEEVSTTENVYNSDNLLIFTGVRKGTIWYSMTLNYYNDLDDLNRLTETVQVVLDETHVQSKNEVFYENNPSTKKLKDIEQLPGNQDDYPVTSYSYERDDDEGDPPYITPGYSPYPGQPYRITDPAGNKRYFEYDEKGNQVLSYYTWEDPIDGDTDIDKYVYTVNYYDGQGRVIQTERIVDNDTDPFDTGDSDCVTTVLSTTWYNSIGKVKATESEYIPGNQGNYTEYSYDELGNLVETRTYEPVWVDTPEPGWEFQLLTTTQNLYDVEGRVIVTVGPYATGDTPVGTETVYNALGRVVETRCWENVQLDLVEFWVDKDGSYGPIGEIYEGAAIPPDEIPVGKKVIDGIVVANAWGTGNDGDAIDPDIGHTIGWKSNGDLPVVKILSFNEDKHEIPLSHTRTIYDIAGRVKHSVNLDESGYEQPTTYYYDKAGKQTKVIDPQGHHNLPFSENATTGFYEIDFDSFTETTHLTGTHETVTTYDGTRRGSVTDARSNTTLFEYDALGRIIKTTYPKIDIDGIDQPIDEPDEILEDDETYTYVGYDGLGRKAWHSAQTMQNDLDFDDSTTDDRNLKLRYKYFYYDTAGRLIMVELPPVDDPLDDSSDPVPPTYRYFYDDFGNQVAIVDAKGKVTLSTYNHLNNVVRRYEAFNPASPVTTYDDVLDLFNDIRTGVISPDYEEFSYDELGRVLLHLDYKEQATLYVYNVKGQLEYKRYYEQDADPTDDVNDNYETNPDSPHEELYYTYDNLGREKTATIREYNIDPVYKRCYEKVYDAEGKITVVNVYPTYADYDAGINLINSIGYGYSDITGQNAYVCTPKGSAVEDPDVSTWISYGYDSLGRLADVEVDKRNGFEPSDEGDEPIPYDDEVTYYEYNPVGSRVSLEYANGNFAEYDYDALNRLRILTNWQSSAMTTGTELSKFEYKVYADGMRSEVTEEMTEDRTVVYTYDDLNRLVEEDARETASAYEYGYNGKYVYDLAGNRRSREVTVTYYDPALPADPEKEQKITTIYTYYEDDNGETDRLYTESHSIVQISLVIPEEQIYICSTGDGRFYYTKGFDGKRISQVRAMLLGLPTRLSRHVFAAALALLFGLFFIPAVLQFISKLRGRSFNRMPLGLWQRCLCALLAYMMLVGPIGFEQLALGDIQYQDMRASDWGKNGETITYTYDDNGSVKTKVVDDTVDVTTYTYYYNLRNRLAKIVKSVQGETDEHVTEYKYNPEGIRVEAYSYDTPDGGDTRTGEEIVDYLIDSFNHTGYAQVFVEDDGTDLTSYVIGDDVLAQVTNDADPEYLLYDGHGSTRQLIASDGTTVVDSFSYDAYGVMLGGNPTSATPAATNLLYAGEQWDNDAQQYYLRARYYNPLNGLFNRIDPFEGNLNDPQSLNKYLYCHNNPVNAIDPSGNMTFTEVCITIAIVALLWADLHMVAHIGWRSMKEDIKQMDETDAMTYFSTGLKKQMNREFWAVDNPEVLRFNMEFWHEKAEMNKAVTIYNARTEMNLLWSIDTAYHGLEIAGIGLGFAGGIAKTPIFWSRPHPSTNPAHWQTITNNAISKAAKGEAKAIYTNSYLSTLTNGKCTVRMAPDLGVVMPSGKLQLFEVVSPTQSYNQLLEKGWRYKQALGDTLEYYDILNIGDIVP